MATALPTMPLQQGNMTCQQSAPTRFMHHTAALQVDASSPVLVNSAAHEAAAAWRTVYLTVACLAALVAVVGLPPCVYFASKYSEYLSSHHDLEALKEVSLDIVNYEKTGRDCCYGHCVKQ